MRPSALKSLGSLSLLLVMSASAQAAERRIGVLVTPAREPLTALSTLTQRALTQSLRTQPDITVVDLGAEAAPQEAARHRESLAEGQRALERARELLEKSALLDAGQSATAAITRFEQGDLEQTMDGLSRALAVSAAISVRQGNLDAARAALTRLFTARPGADIEPELLSPPLRTLAQEVRAAVAGKPRATLSVRTQPTGAAAFLDGAFVGVTPIELTSLPAGDHFLTVKHPGYATAQERFVVEDKLKLSLPLQSAPKGEPLVRQRAALENAAPTASVRSAVASELGPWAKLDEVWLGRVEGRPGKYTVRVYRLSGTGEALGMADTGFHEARINAPETFQSLLADLQKQPAVAAQSPERVSPPEVTKRARWTLNQRTWSYIALGGSAALAGTGLVVGLGAKGKADEARQIAETNPAAYPEAHAQATKRARVADVLFIAAGAGAVTSAILFFTSDAPEKADGLSWSFAPAPGGAAAAVGGRF